MQNDNSQPTVNCPNDIPLTVASPGRTANGFWDEPVAVDNNNIVRRTWRSHAPGYAFPVGVTTVTYMWIDPRNALGPLTCTFSVSVSTTGTYRIPSIINQSLQLIRHSAVTFETFKKINWKIISVIPERDATTLIIKIHFIIHKLTWCKFDI